MLDGGNVQVQQTLQDRVNAGTADAFFKTIKRRLEESTQDVDSSGAVVRSGDHRKNAAGGAGSASRATSSSSTRSTAQLTEEYNLLTSIFRLLQLLCENHNHALQVKARRDVGVG